MKKATYLDGTTETVDDGFALRLYEQGQIKGFAPAEEPKEEAKAEAEEPKAKDTPKKKGK